MPTSVNTKVVRERDSLHCFLKMSYIRVVLDQSSHVLDPGPFLGRVGGDIASETAGVVPQSIARLGFDTRALVVGSDGTQIHSHTGLISN